MQVGCFPAAISLVLRCWPRKGPLTAYIAQERVEATIVSAPGPDKSTKEAAATLGLPDDSRVAKSLVFIVDGEPVLVVARGCDRVNTKYLLRYCTNAKSVRLATPEEAEAVTGFKPGTIGPLSPGMLPSVRIVVDELLMATQPPVFAGCGAPGEHLSIAPAELLRASGGAVARLVEQRTPSVTASASVQPRPSVHGNDCATTQLSLQPLQPLQPGDTPSGYAHDAPAGAVHEHDVRSRPRKVSADIWKMLRIHALSDDELVEFEVLRVRRQGKLLTFASVRERSHADGGVGGGGGEAQPTHRPAVQQLIAGRLLVAEAGEERAAALMRYVRPGAIFRARGRVQRNPREVDSDAPTTADLVARSLQLLVEGAPGAPPAPPRWQPAAATTAGAALAAGADAASAPLPPPTPTTAEGLGATPAAAASTAATSLSIAPASSLGTPPPTLVEDAAGVDRLCAAIDGWCDAADTVGMDLEWRPRRLCKQAAAASETAPATAPVPVALLQLASRDAVYVVDVLCISRAASAEPMARLCAAVGALMRCATATKLGFSCKGDDLSRLEEALPGSTHATAALVDVQPLAGSALGLRKGAAPGLQHACARLLGVGLDKTQQTSDWERRPLTAAQLEYAALDAAVLPPLWDACRRHRAVSHPVDPDDTHLAAAPSVLEGGPDADEPCPASTSVRRKWRQDFIFSLDSADQAEVAGAAGGDGGDGVGGASATALPRGGPMPRQLSLPVDALLEAWLGKTVGARTDVVQLCALLSAGGAGAGAGGGGAGGGDAGGGVDANEPAWGSGGGTEMCGAVTQWADGAVMYINAGRYRNAPSSRYRNRFWREPDGRVLVSWFPGKGHAVTSAGVVSLLDGSQQLLLCCRRAPSHAYLLCGRLQPVAVATPAFEGGAAGNEGEAEAGVASLPVPTWRTSSFPHLAHVVYSGAGAPRGQAAHVVFCLRDADDEMLAQVLGGRAVEAVRPAHYVE